MTPPAALLDSNVLVAVLASVHQHHADSAALLVTPAASSFAIAAHSFAEAYVTLTRGGATAVAQYPASIAWAGLERLRALTTLLGLSPGESVDAVRAYAASGGIGPRLYDALIGQVAVAHGIPVIVTWNTRHLAGLFPRLRVVTPTRFLAAR